MPGTIQPSFAAGELAPALNGRVDLAKYHVGLATCLNFLVMAQGGAQNRPGTSLVGPAIDHGASKSRLIPFQFNTVQEYALEFSDLKMRVIKDGAHVIDQTKAITGISNANPGVVTIAAHGWANGDVVYLSGIVGMVELNGRFAVVDNVTANTFQLQGINTTGYGAWASGGTAARLYTLVTPYAAADLPRLNYEQSNDTMTLTHPGYAPRDLTRTGHAAWSLAVISFASEQVAPTAVTATPSSVSGATTWEYVVTAINATTGEESLPSVAGSAVFKADSAWNAAGGDLITVTWTNAAGANSYNVYKKRNGIFGFIGNAASGATGFVDDKIRADTTDAPPGANNPFSTDWPRACAYHEQRKFFAGTTLKPQTLWGTASGSYKNMNTSVPTQDDDAIQRTLASRQANEIRHMISMGPLLVFTSGAEWMVWPGSQADVLTPANTNARAQSFNGASYVPPLIVVNSVLFLQEKGSSLRDLRYEFQSDSWSGQDLTLLATHLFKGRTIQQLAWHKVPYRCVWAVRDDGVLLAFTYIKEQEVYAWSRIVTDGAVESVCVIGEGNEDAAYVSVLRQVNGASRRYIERFTSREFTRVRDAWFLDCALGYNGNNAGGAAATVTITGATYARGEVVALTASAAASPFSAAQIGRKYELRAGADRVRVTITAVADAMNATATLDTNAPVSLRAVATADWALLTGLSLGGMWHLEGRQVHILGDGSKMPAVTVTGGTVALEIEASRVIVGLPYNCDLETLDADVGQPTIQGKRKRVGQVTVKMLETRGLFAGPNASALTEFKERTTEAMGDPIQPFTGDRDLMIDASWNDVGRIYLRATPGLPATVLALIPELAVSNG